MNLILYHDEFGEHRTLSFVNLVEFRPINTPNNGLAYYMVIQNVCHDDGLHEPNLRVRLDRKDSIYYDGKVYKYCNMNQLAMYYKNKKTLELLEELP